MDEQYNLSHQLPNLPDNARQTVDIQEEAASLMDEIVTPMPVDLQSVEIQVPKAGE